MQLLYSGQPKFGSEGEGAVVTDKSDLVCHEASRSRVTAIEREAAKQPDAMHYHSLHEFAFYHFVSSSLIGQLDKLS